jgi:uncharacterized protein YvpB
MITLPKIYNQNDKAWKRKKLGRCKNLTIGSDGCLISCLAMVSEYYGHEINPEEMNEKLIKKGGYANGCLYIWGTLPKIYKDISERRIRTNYRLRDNNINDIKTALSNGYPVMLWIDYNPKTAVNNMHFVLAIGFNPDNENDITIADPIDGTLKSLKDYLGWFIKDARRTIEAYIIYKGKPLEDFYNVNIDSLQEAQKEIKYLKEGFKRIRDVVNEYIQ